MTLLRSAMQALGSLRADWIVLVAALLLTTAIYCPGLHGGFLFDDYPNIVDNHGVQPGSATLPNLALAALSSPSSDFKRPLASLSFAANYLISGLDPYGMKLTNLVFHLLNGLALFALARALIRTVRTDRHGPDTGSGSAERVNAGVSAAFIAGAWMLLPINLTSVLYIVQRMESMANLFVLLGMLGYVAGRRRMLAGSNSRTSDRTVFALCALSATVPALLGLLAKETAIMLPLYAFLAEWTIFRFRSFGRAPDRRIVWLFVVVLLVPLILGTAWLLPRVLASQTWATRDFTLYTRLLSEARIVADYIVWTVLPTPGALSFYHDDFRVSSGLFSPWTTLGSVVVIAIFLAMIFFLRRRQPLASLGLALFFGCHVLTATIVPLELIFEHRNYFASAGLMLAIIPLLTSPFAFRYQVSPERKTIPDFPVARRILLAGLLMLWGGETFAFSLAWSDPLRLAQELAARGPSSPRALYELGRTYIIYSHYDPKSPFTELAYPALEKAAVLPGASILPEQALIFMNARMKLPIKDAWWDSLIGKLKAHKPAVQDESSVGALTQCVRKHECDLPKQRMMGAYLAALSHPNPSARLLASYSDYAWNILGDKTLGMSMIDEAVRTEPNEPMYRITQIRMLAVQGRPEEAQQALRSLDSLNVGGRLNSSLAELRALPALR